MSFAGKCAVVTGSNSGIGLGVARELARGGAHVALNSFTDRPEDHALAAALAAEFGVKVVYLPADMSRGDDCRRLIADAKAALGSVDILVPNAGLQHVAPIPEFPTEMWDRLIAVILGSTFHTVAAALPLMRAAGWGRIVIIASAHGLTASPFKSAYVAAKHGQIPATMAQYGMDRERVVREVLLQRQPSRQFATVEQIGQTVAFLCSPAADQITGTSISVDGGWTAL